MASETLQYKKQTLDCPVDFVKIDENRARFVAFWVVLLVISYVFTGSPVIIGFLLADFFLRAFNLNAYSPLGILSGAVVKQMGLKSKPVDRAPKRFASFVGIVFLVLTLVAAMFGFTLTSKAIAGVMVVFASLESFFGFCAGCYVYTFINGFKKAA
jgi:hypothetical protein